MRLATVMVLMAVVLAGCSGSPPAPPDTVESAAMVEKNCHDPHWKDQNLGLWYSVCRQSLDW